MLIMPHRHKGIMVVCGTTLQNNTIHRVFEFVKSGKMKAEKIILQVGSNALDR